MKLSVFLIGISFFSFSIGSAAQDLNPFAKKTVSDASFLDLNYKNSKINKIISKFKNEMDASAENSMHASQLSVRLHELDDYELDKALGFNELSNLENFLKQKNITISAVRKNTEVKDLVFVPITPCRVADSRFSTEKRLKKLSTRLYALSPGWTGQGGASNCSLPAEILQIQQNGFPPGGGVALTITAVNPGSSGNLSIYPWGKTPENRGERTSVVNYTKGVDVANSTVLGYSLTPMSNAPFVEVSTYAEVDVIVDVIGYYLPKDWRVKHCVYSQSGITSIAPNEIGVVQAGSCDIGWRAGVLSCFSQRSSLIGFAPADSSMANGYCRFKNDSDVTNEIWATQECCLQ